MTASTPPVTVLMAVHNGEAFVDKAIRSILSQTFADFEFLIVDDGSSDGTAARISAYGDPRIRTITHATNVGLTKSLNHGLSLARGALIARQGCPHGSLCQELGKRADGPGLAAELIRIPVDWAERQFQAMGRPDARDLAVEVIARYQGTALLASTLRDPSLMEGEGRRVARWIDALG